MKFLPLWKCLLIGLPLSGGEIRGEDISWYCTPNKTNLTSAGLEMDGEFQFQLGVFTGGFTPTAGNISEWPAHWVAAGSDSYNKANRAFNSTYHFTGNAAPFTTGAKAYVWGRRAGSSADEWILFRKSEWNWPYSDPLSPAGFTLWNAATANEVVLGSINSNGTPFLMKSAAVVSFNQWKDDLLAGELLNAANDDPDHDGIPNLLEFAFGTSPMEADPPPATLVSTMEISGQRYLQISVPRLRNRLTSVIVEVSSDLTLWNSGEDFTTEISSTSDTLVVRDNIPSGPGLPQRFIRVKAEIQP